MQADLYGLRPGRLLLGPEDAKSKVWAGMYLANDSKDVNDWSIVQRQVL